MIRIEAINKEGFAFVKSLNETHIDDSGEAEHSVAEAVFDEDDDDLDRNSGEEELAEREMALWENSDI